MVNPLATLLFDLFLIGSAAIALTVIAIDWNGARRTSSRQHTAPRPVSAARTSARRLKAQELVAAHRRRSVSARRVGLAAGR